MGPQRDVVGELAARGPRRGPGVRRLVASRGALVVLRRGQTFDSDVRDPRFAGTATGRAVTGKRSEKQADAAGRRLPRRLAGALRELVDKYQPQLVLVRLVDRAARVHPYLQKFAAYYYNRGARVEDGRRDQLQEARRRVVPDTAGVLDVERGQLAGMRPLFWQTTLGVEELWGYIERHQSTRRRIRSIDDLVDIVSKNGALLLKHRPAAPDGTIPEPGRGRMLREMSWAWLAVNG
jgi:alpha-L-fucosidase